MAENKQRSQLSPTVTKVLDDFISAMREDEDIPNEKISRLDEILRKGLTPKQDEISNAVFPPTDGEAE